MNNMTHRLPFLQSRWRVQALKGLQLVEVMDDSGALTGFTLEAAAKGFSAEGSKELAKWVAAYAKGEHRPFKLPKLERPPFTTKVLEYLQTIPFGETRTYAQVAEALGNPDAARAVGNACGGNPFPLIIPCHRVVASADIGGFGFGLAMKEFLLQHEQSFGTKPA